MIIYKQIARDKGKRHVPRGMIVHLDYRQYYIFIFS